MTRRKNTITFKGDAARAFLKAQRDTPPATEKDKLETLAIAVALKVHQGNMADAVSLLRIFLAADKARTAAPAHEGTEKT